MGSGTDSQSEHAVLLALADLFVINPPYTQLAHTEHPHTEATMAAALAPVPTAPNSMYAGNPVSGEWSTGICDICGWPGGDVLCLESARPCSSPRVCTPVPPRACAVSTQSSNTLACGEQVDALKADCVTRALVSSLLLPVCDLRPDR